MNQEIFICGVNVGVNEIVTGKLLNEIVFNLLNQIGMSTSSTILQSNKALSLTQSQDTSYQSIQKIEGIQSHPIERKNDRYKSALRNPSSQINLETSCSLFTNNICTIPTTKQTNSKQTKSEIIQPTESFNPLDKRIKERAKTEMITKEIFIQEDEDFKGDLKYIKESLKYFYKWTELSQCQLIFDSTIEYDPDEYEVSRIFIKDKIKVIGKNILKENNFPFSLKCNGELDIIKKFVRSKTQGVSPLELTLTQTNQIDLKNKPFFFIYGNRDISLKVGLSSCYSTLCDEFIDIRGTLNCCTAMGGSCFNVGRIVVVQLY
ncbi:hypothetical protein KM1_020810 [Entamoeba histolytica HM-3:IMSS]|uniref:Uncharacterized protein n=1 Tax=Entamoeba histolytica HM-3:IMSS TaxID=885315 RepID=M7WB90_ENTHI|nr:hypothetical protein KM1_020810 [Entamoeba histolytica HM-3:IMSS]